MLDAAGITEWVRNAKAGDMAVYARGETISRPVAELARRFHEQGLVDLTRRRDGGGWQFLIQRRSAAFRAGRQVRRVHPRSSAESAILRMIRDAIRLRQPCPTNAEFAEGAGLSGAIAASYRLRKLVRDGKIELIDHGPFERRVAVLVSADKRTVRAPL